MPFVRPTLKTLISRARSDIETRLTGAVATLRNTVEYVLALVVAGAAHGLHGHIVWLSKQLFPDTAEAELMERWAAIWGLERTAAVKAVLTADITGSNGSTCPDATEWTTADGVLYTQDGAATIAAGTATITVEANVGGADGNQDNGTTLSLVSPVAGIDSDGSVTGTTTTGTDAETDAALSARLLERLQSPPKGGGPGDYVAWAKEVAGVTRAWEIPNGDGPGTVVVYFVRDNDAGSIIPDAGEIAAVQTYLDSVAPVTADVNVYAPTAVPLAVTLTALTPNTAAVQTAIEDEFADYILRESEADGVTLYVSQINEAISLAEGETDHVMSVPATDQVYTVGQIATLGTVTFPP